MTTSGSARPKPISRSISGAPSPTRCLAAEAGMGERSFVRHFKAATGRMPAAYVQAMRIEAAKTLLEQSDKPIAVGQRRDRL